MCKLAFMKIIMINISVIVLIVLAIVSAPEKVLEKYARIVMKL